MLAEQSRVRDGAPARDLSSYTDWRETAHPDNLHLIAFYATFLWGQTAGMGRALNLESVRAAMEITGVGHEERAEMTERLISLHWQIVAMEEKERNSG